MLLVFAITTILLTCADHWTTYRCLQAPVEGWTVTEANPVAEWLFGWAGLHNGLIIDSVVTLAAVLFLSITHTFGWTTRVVLLAIISISTGYAVVNNLQAMRQMGLDPWFGVL